MWLVMFLVNVAGWISVALFVCLAISYIFVPEPAPKQPQPEYARLNDNWRASLPKPKAQPFPNYTNPKPSAKIIESD